MRSVLDTNIDPNKYHKVVIFQGVILEFILEDITGSEMVTGQTVCLMSLKNHKHVLWFL